MMSDSERMAIDMIRRVSTLGCSIQDAHKVIADFLGASDTSGPTGKAIPAEFRLQLVKHVANRYLDNLEELRLVSLPKLIKFKDDDFAVVLACTAELAVLRDEFEMGIGHFAL